MPPFIQCRQPPDDSWVTFDLGGPPQVIQLRQPPDDSWQAYTLGNPGGPIPAGTIVGQILVWNGAAWVAASKTLQGTRAQRIAYVPTAADLGAAWFETDTLEWWALRTVAPPYWVRTLTTDNGETLANVHLTTDASTSVLPVTIGGLAANRIYQALLGVRVGLYINANHATNASIDIAVCVSVATDGIGVATCTFGTVPIPDVTLLWGGLLGATATVSASAGGFTIFATRAAGIDTWAFAEWWVERFKDVT